jgi:two-component system cell cycle response regulator
MSARVLVVDDILPNLKLLEARLTAEYFEVLTATNGAEALKICARGECDIVLLDVMMPGLNGFEVCRRLKQDPATSHIPVVLVTALDQASDRVAGLEAGADDFLTKPIDEIALLARVHSLARLRLVLDELRSRAMRSAKLGVDDPFVKAAADNGADGRILLVDDRRSSAEAIKAALRGDHDVELRADPREALLEAAVGDYDLFIISLGLTSYDGLRLCSQIRSIEATRHIPTLAIAEAEDRGRILRGLDLGLNDFLLRPIDRNELIARARTQIRRKRYADCLRQNVEASIEMAAVDALTGLNNRRSLDVCLADLVDQAGRDSRPLSLMILDIDRFKAVNDSYGHEAGDRILNGFAARVKSLIRGVDLFFRLSGDEFVVVMPDTRIEQGAKIAERVRSGVAADQFPLAAETSAIAVTVSVGVAQSADDAYPELLRRADKALYRSKQNGRNRISLDAGQSPAEPFAGLQAIKVF